MTDQNSTPPPGQPQQEQNKDAVMDQVALLGFVEDLIKARNDQTVTPAELPVIRQVLLGEVNQAINSHLVNLLSERQQIELDKLLDTNPSDEQLNNFFTKTIPNLGVEIAAALLNFRAAYLYPIRDQISTAVQSIAPAAPQAQQPVPQQVQQTPVQQPAPQQPAVQPSNSYQNADDVMPAPLPPQQAGVSDDLLADFPLPPAPPAPVPSKMDPSSLKKWN
jgi:hypothetical protein